MNMRILFFLSEFFHITAKFEKLFKFLSLSHLEGRNIMEMKLSFETHPEKRVQTIRFGKSGEGRHILCKYLKYTI